VKLFSATSIRTRLTLWYVFVLAGILVIYISAVFVFQYGLQERQIYHDEVEDVETVEGLLYFDSHGTLQLQQSYYSHPRSHLLIDRLMEVRDLSGVVLYRTPTLDGQSLGGATLLNEGDNSFDARVLKLANGTDVYVISHLHTLEGKELLIRLGYSLTPLRERMRQFLLLQLIAMPIGLIVAGFAGYEIARRALTPLAAMAARAEQITASNLHDRLVIVNREDELGHMARVLNHLLQRLEQAFAQLQRFTADAAHELRTPLASLRAAGEIALQEDPGEDGYRDTISSMLEETVRLNQTIDGLLMLSRAEAMQGARTKEFVLLPELVSEILVLLEVLMEERRITVQQEHDEHARKSVLVDRSLIRVALLNVLHNAVKFSPPDSTLTISYSRAVSGDRETEQVCIHDRGPGIAPGDFEKVFERFYTGSASNGSLKRGTGLGLSIARLTIDRNGGQIFFDPSAVSGARCCIQLPTEVQTAV
jgi:signal transduction histidine kinase